MGFIRNFISAVADSRAYAWARHLVLTTPIEIAFIGVMLSAPFGFVNHKIQKENKHELAFSEISKTRRTLEREGKDVPPLTWQYSITNDMNMQVFEAKNLARGWFRDPTEAFAYELEKKIEPTMRIHHQIPEYAQAMPAATRASLKSLDKQARAMRDLPPVRSEFRRAWEDTHIDITHPETSCDSNGENCTTEDVYDYTIHTYTYHPEHGIRAARLLMEFLQKHPELAVDEKLIPVTSTEADNEQAMRRSIIAFKDRFPGIAEYIGVANIWRTGSNLTVFTPPMLEGHAALKRLSPAWNAAMGAAQSTSYSTTNREDAGPREFQIARAALAQADQVDESIHKFIDGLIFTMSAGPRLSDLAHQCVNTALHYQPGNAKKLCAETYALAQKIHARNFEGGLDPRPYKPEIVLLWSLIGLALGCAIGAGVDKYLNDRQRMGIGFNMHLTRPRNFYR